MYTLRPAVRRVPRRGGTLFEKRENLRLGSRRRSFLGLDIHAVNKGRKPRRQEARNCAKEHDGEEGLIAEHFLDLAAEEPG